MKTKSIGRRLDSVKTYQKQQKILSDWVLNWKTDQEQVIARLRYAAQHDNHSDIMYMISQLEGMTEKRFTALNNVLYKLSDPDRIKSLIDLREFDRTEDSAEIEGQVRICDEDIDEDIKDTSDDINEKEDNTDNVEEIISEIAKSYNAGMTIKEIADWNKVNSHKIVKILVTAGVYTSETYDRIKGLRLDGKSDDEISYMLGLSKATMNDYTPYKKGIYNLEIPTENARNLREYRRRLKENNL